MPRRGGCCSRSAAPSRSCHFFQEFGFLKTQSSSCSCHGILIRSLRIQKGPLYRRSGGGGSSRRASKGVPHGSCKVQSVGTTQGDHRQPSQRQALNPASRKPDPEPGRVRWQLVFPRVGRASGAGLPKAKPGSARSATRTRQRSHLPAHPDCAAESSSSSKGRPGGPGAEGPGARMGGGAGSHLRAAG